MNAQLNDAAEVARIADAPACRDYERVAAAIQYLDEHRREQPRLAQNAPLA